MKPEQEMPPRLPTAEEARATVHMEIKGDIVSPLDAEDWGNLS